MQDELHSKELYSIMRSPVVYSSHKHCTHAQTCIGVDLETYSCGLPMCLASSGQLSNL